MLVEDPDFSGMLDSGCLLCSLANNSGCRLQDAKIHGSEIQGHGFFNIECIGLAVFYRIYYDSIEVMQARMNLNVPS